MKITVNQLRRIIKEEVKRAKRVNLSEGNPDLAGIIEMNLSEEGPAIENIVFNTIKDVLDDMEISNTIEDMVMSVAQRMSEEGILPPHDEL